MLECEAQSKQALEPAEDVRYLIERQTLVVLRPSSRAPALGRGR